MKKLPGILLQASFAGLLVIATACTNTRTAENSNQTGNGNQANGNASLQTSGNSNAPQPQSSTQAKPEESGTGSIAVKTVPPGAVIILISLDEEGALPERKGLTPTTLTDIPVGKYTIDIEKPGYKYYQKDIKVQQNKTTQVAATLKKD